MSEIMDEKNAGKISTDENPKKKESYVEINERQPLLKTGSINAEGEEKREKEYEIEQSFSQSTTGPVSRESTMSAGEIIGDKTEEQKKEKKNVMFFNRLFTAFWMVFFGTGQSCVLFLLMTQTLSNGCAAFPPLHYHHPLTLVFLVFLGRFLILPLILLKYAYTSVVSLKELLVVSEEARKSRKSVVSEGKRVTWGYVFDTDNNKNPMWYVVICLCNIAYLSSILYGMFPESTTWFQALRIGGPVLICIIVLDMLIWQKMPQIRDVLSIVFIMVGVIVLVVPQIFFTINQSYNQVGATKPPYNRWWFGLIGVFTAILYAFQNLKEQNIFKCTKQKYSPAIMTAYEGLFGMLLTVIILFIMYHAPGYDYGEKWENFPCSIVHLFDVKTNPWVLILVILLVALSCATCYTRLRLTNQLSALHQMVFNSMSVIGSIALQVFLKFGFGRFILPVTAGTIFLSFLLMGIGSMFFFDVFFNPIQRWYEKIPFFYYKGQNDDKIYFLKRWWEKFKLLVRKNYKLIICVVFVCVSLFQSILYQLVSFSLVKGYKIPPTRFIHPIFVDNVQFMGQFLCLIVYGAIKLRDYVFRVGEKVISKEEKALENQYYWSKTPVSCSVFLVSSFFDLLFTFISLRAIGEISIIVYQLLTVGALTFVWVAVIKVIIFKHKTYLIIHRVIGIIIILLISTVAYVLNFKADKVGESITFIVVFIILAQAFLGVSLVLEEFFLVQTRPFKPLQIAGFEGFWGIVMSFIISGISSFWDRTWANSLGAIYSVLFFDPVFILLLVGLMLSSGLTNYLKLVIIKELSGKTKIGAEIMVMVISFRVFPAGFIEMFFLPKKQWVLFLKELAPFFVANIFLIYGMLIYTGYLSNFKFWISKGFLHFYEDKIDWYMGFVERVENKIDIALQFFLGLCIRDNKKKKKDKRIYTIHVEKENDEENEEYVEITNNDEKASRGIESYHLNFRGYRGKSIVDTIYKFLIGKRKKKRLVDIPEGDLEEEEGEDYEDYGDEYEEDLYL